MNDLLFEKLKMLNQLSCYEKQGIPIFLDNVQCSPLQVVETCMIKEGNDYMPDFVQDDNGNLYQLRFDKITCY